MALPGVEKEKVYFRQILRSALFAILFLKKYQGKIICFDIF